MIGPSKVALMHMRTIAGRSAPPLGLGCMGMSWLYSAAGRDDETSTAVIRQALDRGLSVFDTADVYGPYTNEELLGRALRGRRDEAIIVSKCGAIETASGTVIRDGSPEHITSSCHAALHRLETDYLDAYLLHRLDPAVPLTESWAALSELRQAGTVRAIGLSEVSVEQLMQCHALAPVDIVQSELSLWTRDHLDSVVAWCADNGVAFMAYSPLGRGFLTGKYTSAHFDADDFRAGNPRFQEEALAQNLAIVIEVQRVADGLGASPAQVALAWVMAQGPHVFAIPGTRRVEHLTENLGALEVVLSESDITTLNSLPAPMGDRY